MAIIKASDLDNASKIDINENFKYNPSTDKLPEIEKPSFGETVKAAFQQENVITNLKGFVTADKIKTDPDFNPYDDLSKLNPEHLDAYIYSDNAEQIQDINDRIARETKSRDVLARSGAMGMVAVLGASVLDPTIAIPGVLGVKALVAGRALKSLVGVSSGAALGGAAVGAQEIVLQGAQEVRTQEETLTNIAFASAVGGIIGGAIGLVSKGAVPGIAQVLKHEEVKLNLETGETVINNRSGSAQEVTLEHTKAREGIAWLNYKQQEEILNSTDKSNPIHARAAKKAKELEAQFKFLSSPIPALRSPIVRGLTSEFELPRRLVNEMFEHTFVVGKNLEGVPLNPMETALKQSRNDLTILGRDVDSLYLDYMGIKGLGKGTISQVAAFTKAGTRGKLKAAQFKEEVARAMRTDAVHPVKQVEQARVMYRKHFLKKAEEMQAQGLMTDLPKDTLAAYLPRYYNTDKILANRPLFDSKIANYLLKGVPNPEFIKLKRADALAKGVDEWTYKPFKGDDADLQLAVNKITNNILGLGDESLAISDVVNRVATASAKSTKARAILIDEREIEEFLHNDLDAITAIYTNKASALTEFQKMLSRNSWESAGDIRKELEDQLERAIVDNPSKRAKLTKQFKDDLDLVNDMISITMGSINKGKNTTSGKALQTLRKYNVVRLLGGVVLSSIPDMMMPIFKHGLPRAVKDGWAGFARDFKKAKLTGDEAKDFGLAMELEENLILKSLHEGDFQTGIDNSLLSKFGSDVVQSFGRVSGLSYWNVIGKRIGGRISGARTIRAVRGGAKASLKERTRLRQLGIDEDMAESIAEQFKIHGKEASGSFVAHFEEWTDIDAARAYAHSMVKEADATTITPGMGDLPTAIQKSELLRTVFQFKGFSSSATNRVLLTGLQRKDMDAVMGLTMLAVMGSVAYMVKEKVAGREPNTDIENLMSEGVSRSGTAGLFGDYMMALNPYATSSRWASLSANGVMLGPSAQLAGDLYSAAIKAPSDGKITDAEQKQILKLLPYQNLFYFKTLMEKMNEDDK